MAVNLTKPILTTDLPVHGTWLRLLATPHPTLTLALDVAELVTDVAERDLILAAHAHDAAAMRFALASVGVVLAPVAPDRTRDFAAMLAYGYLLDDLHAQAADIALAVLDSGEHSLARLVTQMAFMGLSLPREGLDDLRAEVVAKLPATRLPVSAG